MQTSLKILKWCVLTGVFLVPFAVLIISDTLFFPFITGKNFFFRIVVEITFALWLILAIFDKKYWPRKSWLLYIFAAFMAVLILSTIFGMNPYRSFWSNCERMEGLVTFLHLFAYFIVLISVMNPPVGGKAWNWFFHLLLGISVIVGIYGVMQMAGKIPVHQGGTRIDATLGNASYLAIYAVFHMFLGAMLFFKNFKNKEWYKWLYVPIVLLNAYALYNTSTRGAILGTVGGIILAVVLLFFLTESKKVKIISVGALVAIVALLGIFWTAKDSQFVKNSPTLSRFAVISLTERTTQSRFVIWEMSLAGVKEKPLLGWGLENYNLIFNKYYEPILWKQEAWFDRAHNVFVDRLATNGVLGLATYLGLFGCAIYCLLINRKKHNFEISDSVFITAMFAAYFVHNIFVFDNIISWILFVIFLAYITTKTQEQEQLPTVSRQPSVILSDDLGAKSAYIFVIAIATVFVVYSVNIPGYSSAKGLIDSFMVARQPNGAKLSFDEFKKVIARGSFVTTEAREHLISFTGQVLDINDNSEPAQKFKNEVLNYAIAEMQKQIKKSPTDIRYQVFLGSLYNKVGQYDKAIEILENSLKFSPKKQMLLFELGSSYINKQNYARAYELMKKAFDEDSEYDEARNNFAMAAVYVGKIEEAEAVMKDYGGLITANTRLVNAFAAIKRYDKVIEIWNKVIEQNPTNAQYRVSLAASYLQAGDRKKAVEALREAIKLNSDFKQQGEYFIKEIQAGRNP